MVQVEKEFSILEKNKINRQVTENFLKGLEVLIGEKMFENIRSERDFSKIIGTDQSKISKLKSDENRYVTLDILAKAVNMVGMNANHFFAFDENEDEKILRKGGNMIRNDVSGSGNIISNGSKSNNVIGSQSGDIYYADKVIQKIPRDVRKEASELIEEYRTEITVLKKTLSDRNKEIEKKDKKLMELQGKIMELQEKHIKLMEERDI